MDEPFDPKTCRARIRTALTEGEVIWSNHASQEMRKAGLTLADSLQVLRAGSVQPGELERGSWRYRVETRSACRHAW
jgi:hypothetical protein